MLGFEEQELAFLPDTSYWALPPTIYIFLTSSPSLHVWALYLQGFYLQDSFAAAELSS